jgi:hypothetical protein
MTLPEVRGGRRYEAAGFHGGEAAGVVDDEDDREMERGRMQAGAIDGKREGEID